MFNTNNIVPKNGRYFCYSQCSSNAEAEQLRASYLIPVRLKSLSAELNVRGSVLELNTPSYKETLSIAKLLNGNIQ